MKQSTLNRHEIKDLNVLVRFTAIYCRCHHQGPKQAFAHHLDISGARLIQTAVCDDCRDFLDYAIERRVRCPLEPKPTCKHCQIHCYRAGHRERVREIMKFSGPYLIKRGRFDLLWHYFF